MKGILSISTALFLGLNRNNIFSWADSTIHRNKISKSSPNSKPVIIVKIGGSALTNKAVFESLREDILSQTAIQIKSILDSSKDVNLIIIHGAGSFGHFQAKAYNVSLGGRDGDWQKGVCATRNSVVRLNGFVVKRFVEEDLLAVGISPFPTVLTDKRHKVFQEGALTYLREVLDQGFLPVIHGDAILDVGQRCTILSGDKILQWVVNDYSTKEDSAYHVQSVVFLTDVNGVYDKPPNLSGAKLLRDIHTSMDNVENESSLPRTETASHDVTGGILAKLKTAMSIARDHNLPVYIVQAGSKDAYDALSGKVPTGGTIIHPPRLN